MIKPEAKWYMKIHPTEFAAVLLILWSCHAPASVLYVDLNSTNPVAPYADLSTAAVTSRGRSGRRDRIGSRTASRYQNLSSTTAGIALPVSVPSQLPPSELRPVGTLSILSSAILGTRMRRPIRIHGISPRATAS